jgi:hypothetical protein
LILAVAINWAIVAALSSMTSTLIFATTAVLAVGQLNLLRRGGQFDATRRMVDEIKTPSFIRAWTRVIDELPSRMEDPGFRAELKEARGWDFDVEKHPEILVLAYLEELGIYVKHRMISETALLDFSSGLVLDAWERLRDVVLLSRTANRAPRAWEHFEYLYEYVKRRHSPEVRPR